MSDKVRVLVVGCGNMGASHARAYKKLAAFEIAGLVSRTPTSRERLSKELDVGCPLYSSFEEALAVGDFEAVSINSYPDTHAEYAIAAMDAGKHVFLEKPIAETVEEAEGVLDAAKRNNRKLVIGYILRHHPSWIKFIEVARTLGEPLVMRMNLNQQSSGDNWETHKNLMNSMAPIVDCGVHYVDVMCQMTGAKPMRVSAIGARLTDELKSGMYNYGQLQVSFDNGSVGWYEAGWGPMMSETAFFIKDVVGPKGCVSIVAAKAGGENKSSEVAAHTQTESLKVHYSQMDESGGFVKNDELISLTDEPNHDELCEREQSYFLKAIDEDLDLSDHMADAVNSLKIVLAADESCRTGKSINLV